MATIDEIGRAILEADAVGDVETVRALAKQFEELERREYEAA